MAARCTLPIIALQLFIAIAIAVARSSALAAAADVVLAESPEVVLTRADWEADLLRIPADKRDAFASSPQRVQASLNNLLVNRTLAARARAAGLDKEAALERRIALETDRILAAQLLAKIERDARAEFDRNPERNRMRARELYLVTAKNYATAEEIDVSHLLISTEKNSVDAAYAAAEAARAKLAGGADFSALAREISDDRTAKSNGGRLSWFRRGAMDPAFESAAFALANPGDLSPPVRSRFGVHVIRLEGRKPARQPTFEEVEAQVVEELRTKYVNEARDAAIAAIRADPRIKVNQEAVEALVFKAAIPLDPAGTIGTSPLAVPARPSVPAPAPDAAPAPK